MRDLNRGDHDEAEALKFVLGNSGTAPYNSGMCKPLEFCSDSLNGRAIATSAARLDQVVEAARKRQRHRSCICIGSRFFTHANRKRDTRSGPYVANLRWTMLSNTTRNSRFFAKIAGWLQLASSLPKSTPLIRSSNRTTSV